jgi:hypothetical protein
MAATVRRSSWSSSHQSFHGVVTSRLRIGRLVPDRTIGAVAAVRGAAGVAVIAGARCRVKRGRIAPCGLHVSHSSVHVAVVEDGVTITGLVSVAVVVVAGEAGTPIAIRRADDADAVSVEIAPPAWPWPATVCLWRSHYYFTPRALRHEIHTPMAYAPTIQLPAK